MNALGMIEVQSIPLGVNAGDAMLKNGISSKLCKRRCENDSGNGE